MADAEIRVTVRADYALWPGDGYIVIRYTAVEVDAEAWWLVDREGRRHELRPYRLGMFGRDR